MIDSIFRAQELLKRSSVMTGRYVNSSETLVGDNLKKKWCRARVYTFGKCTTMKMHRALAADRASCHSLVATGNGTVDRGRPQHSARTARRLRINLIILATKSGNAKEIQGSSRRRRRGGGTRERADRIDTSRDNGDYRGEHSVFPPPFPRPVARREGSGVPSVCLISGIQSLGSVPGQPAVSPSTNRSYNPIPRRHRHRHPPLPFPPIATGDCRHAATQRHFRTAP